MVRFGLGWGYGSDDTLGEFAEEQLRVALETDLAGLLFAVDEAENYLFIIMAYIVMA